MGGRELDGSVAGVLVEVSRPAGVGEEMMMLAGMDATIMKC